MVQLTQIEMYDLYLNACLNTGLNNADPDEFYNMVETLKKNGTTDRQLEQFKGRVIGQGIIVPKIIMPVSTSPKDLSQHEIKPEHKFVKTGNETMYQSVRDKFGLLIYNKKFNDSQWGAFGVAQNIHSSSFGKCITLVLPIGTEYTFKHDSKLNSSIRHYNNKGRGTVQVLFKEYSTF
jgi:hypothetical protein